MFQSALLGVFGSAFARKLGYIVAAMLCASLFGHKAQSCPRWHNLSSAGSYADSGSACAASNGPGQNPGGTLTFTSDGETGAVPNQVANCKKADYEPPPTGAGPNWVTTNYTDPAGTVHQFDDGTVCTQCQNLPNMDIITAVAGNSGTGQQGLLCVAGCGYTSGANTLVIGGPRASVNGQAVATGSTCGSPNGTQGNCASGGGVTSCYDDTNGKAVVNGEVIDKTQAPAAGKCVVFASGGSFCTMPAGATLAAPGLTTPPAPSNDGTVVDTPVAVVSTPGASGGGIKAAYFSAAQNASSVNPTTGTSAGSPSKGTGSGTGLTAGNGDCGATGVDCAGDGTVPAVPTVPTVQAAGSTYVAAVRGAPIVMALSGIATAMPSGTCPVVNLPVFGHTVVMDVQCTLWDSVASTVGLIMMVCYVLLGVRILMTA